MIRSRISRTTVSHALYGVPVVGLSVALVGALTIGLTGAASAATTPTVKLTVNGTTSSVTTNADTVSALLEQQDVRYDDNDLLSPSTGSKIVDGMNVNVHRAVSITVVDDGTQRHHVVPAITVGQAVQELGLPSGKRLTKSSYNANRFEQTRVFNPAGERIKGNDRIREGSRASVRDIRIAYPDDTYRVKNKKVRERSKLVRQGDVRVYKHGHDGRRYTMWRKVFVDGDLAKRKVVKSRWLRDVQRRVVLVGSGPNWKALARCESGGSPNAVNPAGYYGLYQFSLSTWRAVGGKGNPTDYGYWEQTKRAWILYKGSGRSPWPYCGRFL